MMEETKKTKARESKMEILRIISMILIILHHFACHGGYVIDGNAPLISRMLVDFFIIGGKVGVNIYVMISGYYLINGKFKWSKFAKLIFEVFAYSIAIYAIFLIAGKTSFDLKEFVYNFFPVTFNRYWFVTVYVIVYLLSPFINKLVKALNQKEYLYLIGILIVLQCILSFFTQNFLSHVGWFITLYIIGSYIRLYPNKWLASKIFNSLVFVAIYLTMFFVETFTNVSLYEMTNIVCVIASISLFNLFAFIKSDFSSKFINLIASSTFGIYLIHDNNYVRGFLWRELLKCPKMFYESYFVGYAISAAICVFVACSIIDLLRQFLLEKPVGKLFKKLFSKKTKTIDTEKQ